MSGHLLIFLGTRLVCKVWSTVYLPLDPATFPLYTLGACKFHVSGKQNTPEFDCTKKKHMFHQKREFSTSFSIEVHFSPLSKKAKTKKKPEKKTKKKPNPNLTRPCTFGRMNM